MSSKVYLSRETSAVYKETSQSIGSYFAEARHNKNICILLGDLKERRLVGIEEN